MALIDVNLRLKYILSSINSQLALLFSIEGPLNSLYIDTFISAVEFGSV